MRVKLVSASRVTLFVTLMLLPALTIAATLSYAKCGCRLSIPAVWEQIPATEIEAFENHLPQQIRSHLDYDAGVRPRGSHGYPYVLLGMFAPAQTHLSGYPTESQFMAMFHQIPQVNGTVVHIISRAKNQIKNLPEQQAVEAAMESVVKSGVSADVPQRIITMVFKMAPVGGNPVTTLSVWRFLPNGALVTLNCSARSADFAKYRPVFIRIAASLRTEAPSTL